MMVRTSFNLDTNDLKKALVDYINKITGTEDAFKFEDIDGFQLNQSSEDVREYRGYIGFEEKVHGPE